MKNSWEKFAAWLERQSNQNKLWRRTVLVWACALITWGTFVVFTKPPNMSMPDQLAYATLVGILTVVIGFYFKLRSKDDSDTDAK